MKLILALLFCIFSLYSQKYEYKEIYVRNELGEFKPINIKGIFEIKSDSINLFNQNLKILTNRIIFDEKQQKSGNLYSCTDGTFIYTLLLTIKLNLYFYDKNNIMYKFLLQK